MTAIDAQPGFTVGISPDGGQKYASFFAAWLDNEGMGGSA
jgi:hypothetical protein